jgi:uncharacterized protein (TIGR00369 family)
MPVDRNEIDGFAAMFGRAPSGGTVVCRGCAPLGYCQLGVTAVELIADGGVRAEVTSPARFEGGPGVMHGGWTAAMFDEVLAQLTALRGILTVTSELTVRYHRPIAVDHPLVAEGHTVEHEGDRWVIAGVVRLAGSERPLASATGTWLERDFGHFVRHQAWMASRDTAPEL